MKRLMASMGLIIAACGAQAAELGAVDKPIVMTMGEWTGQHISTRIAGAMLEKLGYEVEYVTAGYQSQFSAIMEGEIHATMEIWETQVGEVMPNAIASGNVVTIGELGIDGLQTWFYPAHVEEMCPGLPALSALNDCAQVFATPETIPQGRFLDYPAEWSSNANRLEALGMNFKPVASGSEGAMIAEIKRSVEQKTPLVLMFWAPHWVFAEYDLRQVELPAFEQACIDDAAWGPNSEATYDCDWKPDTVTKMAWAGFEETWPAAYKLLEAYQIDNDVQARIMKAVDVDGKDLMEEIDRWIAENEATWQSWLDQAKS
ncbi:MAG: ABC transporter substrate-binding protein [Roseovarius sp.]